MKNETTNALFGKLDISPLSDSITSSYTCEDPKNVNIPTYILEEDFQSNENPSPFDIMLTGLLATPKPASTRK